MCDLLDIQLPGLVLEQGVAERKTHFDDIQGGPRNHDLLLTGHFDEGRVVIGVEGKADEPFDKRLGRYVDAARKRSKNTRAPKRVDLLTRAFFGTTLAEETR